jgi:hypothetical protein
VRVELNPSFFFSFFLTFEISDWHDTPVALLARKRLPATTGHETGVLEVDFEAVEVKVPASARNKNPDTPVAGQTA